MMALGGRSRAQELMDVEGLDLAILEACLRDLERINRWTGAYRITLRWLERLQKVHRVHRLVVIDIGSGYGDMLRRIGAWGERRGLTMDLIGVDRNPHAATLAARATSSGPQVRYVTADAFDLPSWLQADAVISALFAHHLDDRQLIRFLRWMDANARFGWLVNDLHRHTIPYWIARWMPGLLGMSPIVQHDAAVSVARAFARPDWLRLLDQAGLAAPPTTVRWCFPFRYAVGRIRPP